MARRGVMGTPLGGGCSVVLGAILLIAGPIASAAFATGCDPATEVQFNLHCFYLDGSGGVCDAGYTLASQSVLTDIAAGFAEKTYKHQVSDNCCVYNSDPVEIWGMDDGPDGLCNRPGAFNPGEPSLGGAACEGDTHLDANQLTLCVSLFTVGAPAPALSELSLLLLTLLLAGTGPWLLRRSRSSGVLR